MYLGSRQHDLPEQPFVTMAISHAKYLLKNYQNYQIRSLLLYLLSYGGNMANTKNASNWSDFWSYWTSCSVQSFYCSQCFLCVSSSEAAWIVLSIANFSRVSLQKSVNVSVSLGWPTKSESGAQSIGLLWRAIYVGRASPANFQPISGINRGTWVIIYHFSRRRVPLGTHFDSYLCMIPVKTCTM